MSARLLTSIALVLLLVCLFDGLLSVRASDNNQESTLLQLERKWLEAENDPDAVDSILADDFIHVLPVGFVTKREQLNYMRSQKSPKREAKHFEDLRVRVFGSAGLVNGIVVATGADSEARRTIFTDVFAYRGGRWQAVNAQELPLRESARTGADSDADLPPNLYKDVSRGNQDWLTGYKAGDAERMVSSYSQDAVFCKATGDCVRGPVAIAALYKEIIVKFGRATDASVHSAGLRVDHDLAYESGDAEAHFLKGSVRKGRFSTVWKRQPDGHWKILHNMSLSAPSS